MKLDPGLEAKKKEAPEPELPPEINAVLKIVGKHIPRFEPESQWHGEWMTIPYSAEKEVGKLKGGSRNWNPLVKKRFVAKVEDPKNRGYYIKRWVYILSKAGFEALKNTPANA